METETKAPEQRTIDVDVEDIDTRGRTLHGYAAVYGVESNDLGGFKETIAPGAFKGVLDADVRCLLNHDPSQVLGRTKSGTMRLADEQRGLKFECDLPDSPLGENVRAAVKRGDIDGASFRFTVDQDEWSGDLRTVRSVKELHDVTVATYGAYPDASVELRTRPTKSNKEDEMSENTSEERTEEERSEDTIKAEERPALSNDAGSLRVEDRAGSGPLGLAEAFRSRGFPGETATISWGEFRTATFGGTVTGLSPVRQDGVPLGYDTRFAYPAFPSVSVGADATSIQLLRQGSRTLPSSSAIVRPLAGTTVKPEVATAGTLLTVPLKQVAAIETNVPNLYLEQSGIESMIETDLRLSISRGFDQLVTTGLASSGFSPPGVHPLLVSLRNVMGTIQASGYNPNTVLLPSSQAAALDTLTTVGTAALAKQDYVFAPSLAPTTLFGMNVRIYGGTTPVVCDSTAVGKLYSGPVNLARFEQDAGSTNRSSVRMETNAAFGVERTAAAIRIAWS